MIRIYREPRTPRARVRTPARLAEPLEPRLLLSLASPGIPPYTPAEVRHAYGMDQIAFGPIAGDGRGQTIAVISAYDNPALVSTSDSAYYNSDLHAFDARYGLPDPPAFTKLAADGSTRYPRTDPHGPDPTTGSWAGESTLDVEWAHVAAPAANIILIEAASTSAPDLFAAVNFARRQPGVSVVSLSLGSPAEYPAQSDFDAVFTTPPNHPGVTFLAATGDTAGKPSYPAASPNVIAVAGTSLTLDANANRIAETSWPHSGGGVSLYEPKPFWQKLAGLPYSSRATPDVAILGDPNTGVTIVDSWDNPAAPVAAYVAGTSLATPLWAGLIAIANQGRALFGQPPLDGPNQTLPQLYTRSPADFIRTATSYNLATGLGAPIANHLVPDLALALPVGYLDSVNSSTPVLTGWAYDHDLGSQPAVVHVYLDGRFYTAFTAAGYRADVPAALPLVQGNYHGFAYSLLGLPTGIHTIDVWVVDNNNGTPLHLGTQFVASHGVTGSLDSGDSNGVAPQNAVAASAPIMLFGWAYDPALGSQPATVLITLDGYTLVTLTAAGARPDVPQALPGVQGNNHGFAYTLPALAPGRHKANAYILLDDQTRMLLGTQTILAA